MAWLIAVILVLIPECALVFYMSVSHWVNLYNDLMSVMTLLPLDNNNIVNIEVDVGSIDVAVG